MTQPESSGAPATAQLCFGQVQHVRLRPVRHAFAYRIFFLRLPLRALAAGQRLAPGLSRNRFNLLSFHDSDHGDGNTEALAWAQHVLAREGIQDAAGEIWLQTFPRVLGYVFNPVSFWFCHRSDGSLRAVLCEVNNTFGERHCYLLEPASDGARNAPLLVRKQFHVSPFCRVEGSYRFRFLHRRRAVDALQFEQVLARIDYHDAEGVLIHTGICGRAEPASATRVMRAFFGYPMMTLMVMARIHWQALRLWLRRVPLHRKPAPPAHAVSKNRPFSTHPPCTPN